jgi:hypothetical protein
MNFSTPLSTCLLAFSLLLSFGPATATANPTVLVENGFTISMYQVGNKTGIEVEENGVIRFELEKTGANILFKIRDASGKVLQQGSRFDAIPSSIFSAYPGLKDRLDQSFKPADPNDLSNPNSRAAKLKILRQHNPAGHVVIERLKNKEAFDFFSGIQKGKSVVDALDTGVHEGLHLLDGEIERANSQASQASYFLIDQKIVEAPRMKTFHRSQVVKLMTQEEKADTYVETYLEGTSGAQGLEVLLDELNAYAHGAWTTIELSEGLNERHTINPGLVAMMDFTAKYLRLASEEQKDLYRQMKSSRYSSTIEALWSQAEVVLNRACASKRAGLDGTWKGRLKRLYQTPEKSIVETFIGHRLEIPVNCR